VLLLTRHALISGDLNARNQPKHFKWGSQVSTLLFFLTKQGYAKVITIALKERRNLINVTSTEATLSLLEAPASTVLYVLHFNQVSQRLRAAKTGLSFAHFWHFVRTLGVNPRLPSKAINHYPDPALIAQICPEKGTERERTFHEKVKAPFTSPWSTAYSRAKESSSLLATYASLLAIYNILLLPLSCRQTRNLTKPTKLKPQISLKPIQKDITESVTFLNGYIDPVYIYLKSSTNILQ